MHYCSDPSMVRVDIWKASGKWYSTEQMKWLDYDGQLIHDEFRRSFRAAFPGRYIGMTLTCLEPYHEHGFPLMIVGWEG